MEKIRLAKKEKCGSINADERGYSLMAKLQPSKLIMRVRFPLPAEVRVGVNACKFRPQRGPRKPCEAMGEDRKALLLSIGYGRGHEAAAKALAQEMEARGWCTRVSDLCAEAKPLLFRGTQTIYRACVRKLPWVWGVAYAQIDATDWAHMLCLPGIAGSMRRLRDVLRTERPKLIVCTYPLYAYMLDALSAKGELDIPYAVVVTDALHVNSAWVRTQAPLICLPDEESRLRVRTRFGVAEQRLCATGFPVRREFTPFTERCTPREDGQGVRVVYGAHAQPGRVCADVQGMLETWPAMEVTLLAEEREERLRSMLGDAGGRVHYLGGAGESIAESLRRAHFYIGKAGAATVFEAYATQTPVLVNYALPGQEEGNQQLLINDGAGARVDSTAELLHVMGRLLECGAVGWQRMVQAMRLCARGNGAALTVDAIEQLFS